MRRFGVLTIISIFIAFAINGICVALTGHCSDIFSYIGGAVSMCMIQLSDEVIDEITRRNN